MPGGDRTGPWGAGPMTGRAAGFCAGYDVPGYANPMPGRGFGGRGGRGFRGRGGGRGWRHMYYATGLTGWQRAARGPWAWQGVPPQAEPAQELDALKQEAEGLENSLADIRKRIGELESKADS